MEFQVNLDKVIFPSEWLSSLASQKSNCQLYEVSLTSEEGKRVISKFNQTASQCKILKVQRIQNKWLWEQYFNEKQKLQKKIGNSVNEMELFHGTKNTQPRIIYNGEDGFDMRFSNAGMWGQGTT